MLERCMCSINIFLWDIKLQKQDQIVKLTESPCKSHDGIQAHSLDPTSELLIIIIIKTRELFDCKHCLSLHIFYYIYESFCKTIGCLFTVSITFRYCFVLHASDIFYHHLFRLNGSSKLAILCSQFLNIIQSTVSSAWPKLVLNRRILFT